MDIELLLCILLLVAVGAAGVPMLMRRVESRNAGAAVSSFLLFYGLGAVVLLLIGGVLGSYADMLLLLLLCVALLTAGLSFRFLRLHRKQIRPLFLTLLVLYLLVMLFVTILSRLGTEQTTVRTDALASFTTTLETGATWALSHFLINVLMFMPGGFLTVLTEPRTLNRLAVAMLIGITISTGIETMQLFLRLGECDMGDILSNTVGSVLGALLARQIVCKRL